MKREVKLKGPLFRTFAMEPARRAAAADAAADAPVTYDLTVSTEAPVERTDWWTGERFLEVLGHNPGEVDTRYLDAGAAVLEEHRGVQVGVEDSYEIADARLRAAVRFSKNPRGQEVERDVADGIRRHVSVGYEVKKYLSVGKSPQGIDILRAVEWTPYEISLVGIPADLDAGVGRAKGEECEVLVRIQGGEPEEERKMKKVRNAEGAIIEVADDDPRPAVSETRTSGSGIEFSDREVDLEAQRAGAIHQMAESRGVPELATELIAKGLTVREAAGEVLKAAQTRGKAQPAAETLRAPEKDVRSYSLARALRSLMVKGHVDGFEGEVQAELERNRPVNQERHERSLLVPLRLVAEPRGQRATAMATTTSGYGAEIVITEPGQMIDILRPRALVIQSGATVLSGLSAPVQFPVQTGDMTVTAVTENPSAVADSDISLTTRTLTPKTIQSTIPLPRQLLVEASPTVDVEQMVRNSIMAKHDRKIDYLCIHGSGASYEPYGIYSTTSVLTEDMGGVPTYAKLVEMASKIADEDADIAVQRWMTTPLMAGVLKTTPLVAGFPTFIWEGNLREGSVAGYSAACTNQVSKTLGGGSDHGIVFGAWSELVLGLFGAGIEIVVDPYTLATKGQIRITSFQMFDCIVRHPEAFCVATTATIE